MSPRWSAPSPSMSSSPPAPPRPPSTLLTPDWRMGRGAAAHVARLYVSRDRPSVPAAMAAVSRPSSVMRIGVDANGVCRSRRRWPPRSPRMTATRACRWSPSMLANNETGVIQPVREIAAIVQGSWRRARASTPCRRPAGSRSTSPTATARLPHSLLAQDRRAQGRRRAVVARIRPDDADAADHAAAARRRAIARAPRMSPASPASAPPRKSRRRTLRRCGRDRARCATASRRRMLLLRPTRKSSDMARAAACQHDLLRHARPEGRDGADRASISPAWRFPPGRPARRARSAPSHVLKAMGHGAEHGACAFRSARAHDVEGHRTFRSRAVADCRRAAPAATQAA